MFTSASVTLRQEGNRIYKSACVDGLSPAIQLERLQNARNLYIRAHNSEGSQDDKCSAAKNAAQCEWRIGKLRISRKEKEETVIHHFKEALRHYQYAFVHGNISKDSQWMTDLKSKYSACFDDLELFFSEFSLMERIRHLTPIASLMAVPEITANVYLRLTQHNFHEGINAWQKGDYVKCKNQMAECHFPMHEARRHGCGQSDLLHEIDVLETDVHVHMCIAESSKSRQIGDELLEKATRYYETVDINMVWEIIDWYKQAILLARELDMEQEAIAMQRIGRVYAKVLKFKPQAKEYYKRAIQLAVSMEPRTFTTCDWYNECSEMLKKYQEETLVHEQEQLDKEREKIREEIKAELEEVKTNHEKKTNIEFLLYVYKAYPPKNTALQMEKDAEDNMKKALQKAILHYHPDKSEPEKNGMKWKVLSEEITKYLTKRYECFKFNVN